MGYTHPVRRESMTYRRTWLTVTEEDNSNSGRRESPDNGIERAVGFGKGLVPL